MASKAPSTPIGEISKRVDAVKQACLSKKAVTVEWRRAQLKAVKKCLLENWDSVRYSQGHDTAIAYGS